MNLTFQYCFFVLLLFAATSSCAHGLSPLMVKRLRRTVNAQRRHEAEAKAAASILSTQQPDRDERLSLSRLQKEWHKDLEHLKQSENSIGAASMARGSTESKRQSSLQSSALKFPARESDCQEKTLRHSRNHHPQTKLVDPAVTILFRHYQRFPHHGSLFDDKQTTKTRP